MIINGKPHSRTRIYRCWSDMKKRCKNPNDSAYKNYGGRGIRYDPKWEIFEGFWEDMRDGYSDNLTLERVDVNGDYCKENCKWIPKAEQGRNQRKRSTNTSGITGIYKKINRGNNYWAVQWIEDGKYKYKYFSWKKLGKDEAMRLAIIFRENIIEKLNNLGYNYGEDHGK